MSTAKISARLISVVILAGAVWGQTVPGMVVEEYATLYRPLEMTFGASGVMYVGRGDGQGLANVRRIGPGGAPIVDYGSAIYDPDTVLYDASGSITGTPGAVLVAGHYSVGVGRFSAILPDQQVSTLFNTSGVMGNPQGTALDSLGRAIVTSQAGEVYAFADGGATFEHLFTLSANNQQVDVDLVNDYIFTAPNDGTIRIHDLTGAPVGDGVFSDGLTVGLSNRVVVGPGSALWGAYLYAVDKNTGELLAFDESGSGTVVGTGFNDGDGSVADLAFGPDGALYVSFGVDDRIIRIIPEPGGAALLLLGLAILAKRR